MGLPFFGLKDYSQCQCQCQCHFSAEQEKSLKTHFTNNHALNADEISAYILAEYGQSYCPSGAVELMQRLGFTYPCPHKRMRRNRKPSLPTMRL
jgi:transposase